MTMTIEDLTGDQLKHLLEQTRNPTGANLKRRKELRVRWKIMTDDFDDEIKKRVGDLFFQDAVVAEIVEYAMVVWNPLKRAVRRVAVGYKKRPKRRIEGANKTQSKNWATLLRKLQIDTLAKQWHQFAIALNTIVVLARERELEGEPTIGFDMITGAVAEVVPEPGAPSTAPPGILAYKIGTGEHGYTGPDVVTVDSRWYLVWSPQNNVIEMVPHELGRFPGSTLRSIEPVDIGDASDWWNPWPGKGGKQATIECGQIAATMGWTRKTQSRKLLALLRNGDPEDSDVPEGQVMHPELPLNLRGEVEVVVHDLQVAVDMFIKHITALTDETEEQLSGMISTATNPDPAHPIEGGARVDQHAATEEIREDQIGRLEPFDRDLQVVIATMADDIGMEEAIPPDLVIEGAVVEFSSIPFLDTPMERLKVWEEETKFGIGDQVTAAVEKWGVSEEEAIDRLEEIAKRRQKLNALRASGNEPKDPTDPTGTLPVEQLPGEALDQVQGRAGGVSPKEQQPAA